MEWNQIVDNGAQLYGNFSTAEAAVALDVQNMDSLLFRVSFLGYFLKKDVISLILIFQSLF